MRGDHPIDQLVVMVEGGAPAHVFSAMQTLSRRLTCQREWVFGPPELIGEADGRASQPVGLVLSLYTGRPPWGEELDRTIDRAHLDDVKELRSEICRISGEHHISFVVDFAEEAIGTIEEGRMDESLAIGLIAEWARVLDERDQ